MADSNAKKSDEFINMEAGKSAAKDAAPPADIPKIVIDKPTDVHHRERKVTTEKPKMDYLKPESAKVTTPRSKTSKHNAEAAKVETTTKRIDPIEAACIKKNKPEAFAKIEKARADFKKASDELMNFEQIEQQVNATTSATQLKIVMTKFCENSTKYNTNLNEFIKPFVMCVDSGDLIVLHSMPRILSAMAGQACSHKDLVLRYIAEHGFYCPKSSIDGIIECVYTKAYEKKMPLQREPHNLEVIAQIQSCAAELIRPCDKNPAMFKA